MNITKNSKTLGLLIAAVFAVALASEAQAGPGPQQIFYPVKTMKQARSIPIGQTIAVSCGNCGGVSTFIVDQDRSYLHSFTCPACKRTYRVSGHGGEFAYGDDRQTVARLAATQLH